uniref:glutathione gamma-glutamylcysteinyltransferase n=1 Tax=Amphora coffeiformis TaxID=265554 RepID=A0A7S3LAH1_9STRA
MINKGILFLFFVYHSSRNIIRRQQASLQFCGRLMTTMTTAGASHSDSSSFSMAPAAPNKAIKRTFYRRPLPETCIALRSKAGQDIFCSAMKNHGLKSFFGLIEQFSTQAEPAYCGITTLTVCLNAFLIDPRQTWKAPWRWYTEAMLNCCISLEEVKKTGIILPVFRCLAICQGLNAHVNYAQDTTLEHFRSTVREACVMKDGEGCSDCEDGVLEKILVVSYNRQGVGQTGTGHFSPIGAYDPISDSVLILDTARFKYGVHWVSLEMMYKAMQSIDPDTGKSRGYVLLVNRRACVVDDESDHGDNAENDDPTLPISVLLRSPMDQNEARHAYKTWLLENHSPTSLTWEHFVEYWSNGAKNYDDVDSCSVIWDFTRPKLKPVASPGEEDQVKITKQMIRQLRRFISEIIPSESHITEKGKSIEGCATGRCSTDPSVNKRTIDLHPREAMVLVYLASIDEQRQHDIINGASLSAGEDEDNVEVKRQLMAEIQLLRYAIDISSNEDIIRTAA